MDYKVKLTSKGQMTIPKELRDKLRLNTGITLKADIMDGKLVLEPIYPQNDELVIMEYAAKYTSDKKISLQELRKKTAGLSLNMGEYVRKTRDEEADGKK